MTSAGFLNRCSGGRTYLAGGFGSLLECGPIAATPQGGLTMFASRRILATSAAAGIALVAALVPFAGAEAAATPQCTNANLAASSHHTDSGASHQFGQLVLKNVSQHRCRTGGYGGLSYVGDGNGAQIGAAADRDPGTVSTIVLQPGQK